MSILQIYGKQNSGQLQIMKLNQPSSESLCYCYCYCYYTFASKVKVDNVVRITVTSHLCFAGCPDPGFTKYTIFTPKPYTTAMGESIHVSCKAGYHFAQSEHTGKTEVEMICTYKGWNVKQVPECKRK